MAVCGIVAICASEDWRKVRGRDAKIIGRKCYVTVCGDRPKAAVQVYQRVVGLVALTGFIPHGASHGTAVATDRAATALPRLVRELLAEG